MDATDIGMLTILQRKARTKRQELASLMQLSIPAISERMKKLEASGIIREYRAALDHRKLGFDVSAFIAVTVDSSKHYKTFLSRVQGEMEVQECHAVTGKGTHLLKVMTKNTQSLEKLLSRIQLWPGVVQTITSVVLSSPKESSSVPLAAFGPHFENNILTHGSKTSTYYRRKKK